MIYLASIIWFLIPAAVANGIPPLAAKVLPGWDQPIDCGLTFRGKALLGSHKTFRGLVSGVLMAALVHQLQIYSMANSALIQSFALDKHFYDYSWLGAWMGFLALMGDAIKSFFKRQAGIAPGKPWLPWDKIDWVIATLVGSWLILEFSGLFALTALLIGLLTSTSARLIGYWLGINDTRL